MSTLIGFTLNGQMEGESVTLVTETGNLMGTLLLPKTTSVPPTVLIIAGSGPTDRNGNFPMGANNSLKMLAEGLCQNGIASIRYDKRGIGESSAAGLAEQDLRFEHYVDDVKAWIAWIHKDARFGDLTIVGHSEGSLLGMIASQDKSVTNFVSVSGAGSPAGDLIREQLKEQPPVVLEQALPILEKLEEGQTTVQEEVPQMLFALFRPSVQPYMVSWFKYDPQEEIAKLSCPVLLVQGTTDIQVSTEEAEKLAKAHPSAQMVLLEGMNHVLKTAPANRMENLVTYSNPDLPLHPELISKIASFILEHK